MHKPQLKPLNVGDRFTSSLGHTYINSLLLAFLQQTTKAICVSHVLMLRKLAQYQAHHSFFKGPVHPNYKNTFSQTSSICVSLWNIVKNTVKFG